MMVMVGTTSLATVRLKYVNIFRDRHGKTRAYYRRNGRSVALPGEPGSEEFLAAYNRELDVDAAQAPPPEPQVGRFTFDRLIAFYLESPDFIRLGESTQRTYRATLRELRSKYGHRSVKKTDYTAISRVIAGMADRQAAANKMLKRMRTLFALAIRLKWIETDPSAGIKMYKSGEIHTWTAEEHAAFLKHWPAGSKARLAYMLHYHTGQRKSDVVRMTRPKSINDPIRLTQVKTKESLVLPVSQALWEEIERHPKSHLMMLTTGYGKPFTANGYGAWFRKRCDEAGLPQRCSSHGLRKAAAADLAEAGCSANEIASVTGHRSLREVERYTRRANQERLARNASKKRDEANR